MLRKFITAIAASAAALSAVAPVAAQAQYYGGDRYERVRQWDGDRGRYDRRYDRRSYERGRSYDRGRSYGRGYDRGRCRDSGTGGTILGAIAGGLLGHEIGNGRYDRGDGTTGAIVGAGVGALAGRAIDRNC